MREIWLLDTYYGRSLEDHAEVAGQVWTSGVEDEFVLSFGNVLSLQVIICFRLSLPLSKLVSLTSIWNICCQILQ